MSDLPLVVRELLELGPPRLPGDAVLELLARHSLLPAGVPPLVDGSHLSWPEAHGPRVHVRAPGGLVTDVTLAIDATDDPAAADTVAEVVRAAKRVPGAGRVRRRQGVTTVPVGQWVLELRTSSSPAQVWAELTETFTWPDLIETAEEYLRVGFSRDFALRRRLVGPEDTVEVGRHQLWHGAEPVFADVDDLGLASLRVPTPREWGGRGDKLVQLRALADDLDRLGDGWEGRRCYGWRAGDRWVLLTRSDFERDFSLVLTRHDALSDHRADEMWLLADHAPGSEVPAGTGLPTPEELVELVRAVVSAPRPTRTELHSRLVDTGLVDESAPDPGQADWLATLTSGVVVRCRTRGDVVAEVDVELTAGDPGFSVAYRLWNEVADRFGPSVDVGHRWGRPIGDWLLREHQRIGGPVRLRLTADEDPTQGEAP